MPAFRPTHFQRVAATLSRCAVMCCSFYVPGAFQNELYHTYFPQTRACQVLSTESLCSHAQQAASDGRQGRPSSTSNKQAGGLN